MGIVIAVDGVAASGKGTLSRALAAEFGYAVLDTGKLYRAVAAKALEAGVAADDEVRCGALARALTPAYAARPGLGGEAMGSAASRVSGLPQVRAALLGFQRSFAGSPPGGAAGAVLDGRDIGTVVCPGADAKFFLTADPAVRAARRAGDEPGTPVAAIEASIRERDAREAARAASPLVPAEDAVILDTSRMTPGEVLRTAMETLAGMGVRPGGGRGPGR